jgi:RimJ/RimL family protein N-acetyltransferase
MAEFRIETERLILREWRGEDADALYPTGRDPHVMEFYGPLENLEGVQTYSLARPE